MPNTNTIQFAPTVLIHIHIQVFSQRNSMSSNINIKSPPLISSHSKTYTQFECHICRYHIWLVFLSNKIHNTL